LTYTLYDDIVKYITFNILTTKGIFKSFFRNIKFKEIRMIKKMLFAVISIAMVLSTIASISAASVQSSDIEITETAATKYSSTAITWLLLTPTKDASFYEGSPDTNIGAYNNLYIKSIEPWYDLYSYQTALEFDLSAIPKDAVITSATLELYLHDCDEAAPGLTNIGCDRQPHTDWVENEATWNVYKTGSSWTIPGGDWLNEGLVVTDVYPSYRGWVSFNVQTILEDSHALSIPAEFLLRTTAGHYSLFQFWSRDTHSDYCPKLEIEYETGGLPTSTPAPTSTPTPIPTPSATPTPTPTAEPLWSFAIITDLHIGEGIPDYGNLSWNDDPNSGQETMIISGPCVNVPPDGHLVCQNTTLPIPSVQNLRIAALWANNACNPYSPYFLNTQFVVVDGDLTDSAEISEFGKAKEILNTLNVPWIPTMGNHDVWPYINSTNKAPATEEIAGVKWGPDRYYSIEIQPVYYQFATELRVTLNRSPSPVWNSKIDTPCNNVFQNFAFDYSGYHFVGLDFNERNLATNGKGVNGNGNLYYTNWIRTQTLTDGTWDWFKEYIRNYAETNEMDDDKVILLAHHPFYEYTAGIWPFGVEMGFEEYSAIDIQNFLACYGNYIYAEFCGHLHWLGLDVQHFYNYDIVKTDANKDDPKVRIVQVFPNGTIDYDTILPQNAASIMAHCPVDLILTDPDGLIVSRTENQVPGAMYYKWDFDEDGQLETKIWIAERKTGNYSIQVVPESYANESDTFSLTVSPMEHKWGYTPITIAQNVTVSDIPTEPYIFEFTQRTATNVSYIGDVSGYNLDAVNLKAFLSAENGSPLPGKTVNFLIGNQSASSVSDFNGVATTSITLNQTPNDFYYVEYGFDGDIDYLPCYDAQLFVIPPLADSGGPYTGIEGSPITLDGNGTYDPESRVTSYEWDLDNDGVYDDATGVAPSYTWNDDYSGTIGLQVTDNRGTTSLASTTVTVNNVPPTVEAGADISNVIAGTAVNFSGSFTDPATLDTHTIVWDFDDGSPTINGTLTPSHTYTTNGNYVVTLIVTDDDGGVGTDTLTVNVMPTATTYTFASGGGINKWCWEGHVHLIDWLWGHPTSPADFANSYGYVAGGPSAYSAVSSSDNMRWRSDISHCLGCCAFDRNAEMFTFKIAENPSTITNIKIKWEGHGTTGEIIYYTTEKLWNASVNSWITLNNQKNITSDVTWTNNISSDCSKYIDGTGNLSILVSAQRSGLPNNCGIWTDYIEVTIAH